MRLISVIAGIMLIGFSTMGLGAKPMLIKQILAADVNHDGVVSQNSLENGEDYILIKPNPARLNEKDAVFVTTKSGIYSSANIDDLMTPYATRNLFLAKMLSSGEIKPFTLANLGYNHVQVVANNKGQQELVLGKLNGQTDKIFVINYKTQLPPLKTREEIENKKRVATGKSTSHSRS